MIEGIANLGSGAFLFWSVLLTLLSLLTLYFSFYHLHRARLIEDTPTSRIRSAPQGYVELIGEADMMRGEPVISPLSATHCCWWRYKVERKNDNGWRTIRSEKSNALFLLRDATGECIIDPEEANVTSNERTIWYGPNATPSTGPDRGTGTTYSHFSRFGLKISINTTLDGDYRYTEELILPGDPLYAIGLFSSLGELDREAMRDEMLKDRLRQWKSDNATLLERFDKDGNGQIDLDEWELARQTAKREITQEQMKEEQQPIHILSATGSNRRPLLVSTKEEFALVRRFRYYSFFTLAAFFILGSGTAWFIAARMI